MSEAGKPPDFTGARVLVVGDVMLDRNWIGAARRISPEAPVPVVTIDERRETPGGAANVAMNVAALGGRVSLSGLIGEDEAGYALRGFLADNGIGDALRFCALPTITKLRVLSRHQQLIRLDFESRDYSPAASALTTDFPALLDGHDVVVFSDYGKGALSAVDEMIACAKKQGKTVLVDPKGRDFSRYAGADIVTPNVAELAAVTGGFAENALVDRAREALRATGIFAFLVTQGEKGMTYVDARRHHYLAARAREVFDVTGAGDTVIATLAAGLSSGFPLDHALWLSNAAASVSVSRLGTAVVDPHELRKALEPQRASTHGVVDREELREHVRRVRARGQTVVMTNGCFDILHAGHVTYLEEAKALGDRLIVAVNSDASLRRLKGPGRPANTLASRARVLAALQSVDWVVAFDDDTPETLIEEVSPDILVKGGDNRAEEIAGAQWVLAHGGEVRVLSYLEGFSTTKTLAEFLRYRLTK